MLACVSERYRRGLPDLHASAAFPPPSRGDTVLGICLSVCWRNCKLLQLDRLAGWSVTRQGSEGAEDCARQQSVAGFPTMYRRIEVSISGESSVQTNTRYIFTLGLMAAAAATLVACGGGDDSPTPSQPSATVSGKAVDFYLSGATVTFLDCANKTVKTNATGDFTFPDGCTRSALKVTGGTDIGTGQPFSGVLQAPAVDYKAGVTPVISPLTTLVAQLGPDQAAALATKLGLGGKDLATLDPMQDAASCRRQSWYSS